MTRQTAEASVEWRHTGVDSEPAPRVSAKPDAPFAITTFLEGRTFAWGVFEDRFGKLRRRFEVEMNGRWSGDVFELHEEFRYDTGDVEQRIWLITPGDDGRFTGTTEDCVGVAEGRCDGESIRMNYRFRLRVDQRMFTVDFDDRIYRLESGLAINRATMRKWGVKLGELSLFFMKRDEPAPRECERPAGLRSV